MSGSNPGQSNTTYNGGTTYPWGTADLTSLDQGPQGRVELDCPVQIPWKGLIK